MCASTRSEHALLARRVDLETMDWAMNMDGPVLGDSFSLGSYSHGTECRIRIVELIEETERREVRRKLKLISKKGRLNGKIREGIDRKYGEERTVDTEERTGISIPVPVFR